MLVSIIATGVTYLALYHKELVAGSVQLPGLVRGLSIRRLSELAVQWLRISKAIIEGLPLALSAILVLGFFTGLIIGTWKLATSSLSVGAKVAIALFVIWLPLLSGLPLVYQRIYLARAR